MIRMLNSLNVRTEYGFQNNVHIVNNKKLKHIAPYELVTAMRASFLLQARYLRKQGLQKCRCLEDVLLVYDL